MFWGPGFALTGALLELVAGGPVHTIAWVLVGLTLLVVLSLWVYSRRRFLSVRLTPTHLWQGRESLAVSRIAEVDDVGSPIGVPVLGGGWSAPRKYEELPLRLDDGSVVLAWARDGVALREALRGVVAGT
ncbi:hypothetical protein CFN78_00540 [Amycolatopsis antarctica]|uniref:DUF3093 domain-containing protein n=1 Tax=Amycolatopsis antarctica TaxID=1854586 RepID=A0A263DCL2_9PSEU|nr:hypothetical protein CFN78_00540 [Amycolatopsis antarctica]